MGMATKLTSHPRLSYGREAGTDVSGGVKLKYMSCVCRLARQARSTLESATANTMSPRGDPARLPLDVALTPAIPSKECHVLECMWASGAHECCERPPWCQGMEACMSCNVSLTASWVKPVERCAAMNSSDGIAKHVGTSTKGDNSSRDTRSNS